MNKYNKLSYEKLRSMVLDGNYERKYMNQPVYERLLDGEAALYKPSAVVLEFCVVGLKQFDKYKHYDEAVIWGNFVAKQLESEQAERKTITFRKPKPKRVVLIAAAIVLVVGLSGCAVIASIYGWFLDLPLFTRTEQDGYDYLRTDGVRVYESMEAMLKLEKLNILYPTELPNGYEFTDFEVSNLDTNFEVAAYADEPLITFSVRIGANFELDDCDYEVNGIKYNIGETEDGKYQATWVDGEDYYWVTVSDESVIPEIIENLQRSSN